MKDQHFVYRVLQAVNINPSSDEDVDCFSEEFDPYFKMDEDYPGFYRVEIDSDEYVICTEDGALCCFEDMLMDETLSYFNATWINDYMPDDFDLKDTEALMEAHPAPRVIKRLIGDKWDAFLSDSLWVDGIEHALYMDQLEGACKIDGVYYWVFRV